MSKTKTFIFVLEASRNQDFVREDNITAMQPKKIAQTDTASIDIKSVIFEVDTEFSESGW